MRIALGIQYDGTAFCGWQSQPHGKTVQLITRRDQLGGSVVAATQYLPGERGE